MNKKVLSIILAVAVAVATFFLFEVLASSSGFNFLPYLIHESIWKGGKGEGDFIRIFDIAFSILLFWVTYKIVYRILKWNGVSSDRCADVFGR